MILTLFLLFSLCRNLKIIHQCHFDPHKLNRPNYPAWLNYFIFEKLIILFPPYKQMGKYLQAHQGKFSTWLKKCHNSVKGDNQIACRLKMMASHH